MIKSISILNFKNIKKAKIDFNRLTVFVGANGSGKTSVLESVNLAIRSGPVHPAHAFAGKHHCDWLYTRGGVGQLSLICEFNAGRLVLKASPPEGAAPRFEDMGTRDWDFDHGTTTAPVPLKGSRLFRLDPQKLIAPSYTKSVPPRLEDDGANLPSVLEYMALNDPDSFAALTKFMRELIPELERIRFSKTHATLTPTEFAMTTGKTPVSNPYEYQMSFIGDSILFDFSNARDVAAHSVSEGTILSLGLLAILLGPERPDIILLDDLERGLHPLAQKSFLEVLNRVMEQFPDLQIIATAHSPYLLDQLAPEQIRLMTTNDEGYSICGKLIDHPQFERWKSEMAPGELWSLFGEKWISEAEKAN